MPNEICILIDLNFQITNRMEPTKQFIQDLISNELAYINTRHPDFADARHQACQNLLKVESFTDLTPEVQKLKMNGEATPRKQSEKGSGDNTATPQTRRVAAKKDKMNPKEKRECEVVERLIKTYFLIIRKNIQVKFSKRDHLIANRNISVLIFVGCGP